jgi:hypothetical protein
METPEQPAANVIQFPAMQSASIGKLVGALAKAQAKIQAPKKSKTAKVRSKKGEEASYTYQYADLEDTIESIKGPMAEAGLAYYHLSTRMPGDDRTWIVTRICLSDTEEWIQTALPVATVGNLQELGGCLTYLQKYNLRMLLGQSGGDRDDDGASVVDGAADDDEILEARRQEAQERADAEAAAKKAKREEIAKANYASGKFKKVPPADPVADAKVDASLTPPATNPTPPAEAAGVAKTPPATNATVLIPPEKPHLAKLRKALAEEGVTPEVFMGVPQVLKNIGAGASWEHLPVDFVEAIMEAGAWGRLKAVLPPPY